VLTLYVLILKEICSSRLESQPTVPGYLEKTLVLLTDSGWQFFLFLVALVGYAEIHCIKERALPVNRT
jgi:hypothetical protein